MYFDVKVCCISIVKVGCILVFKVGCIQWSRLGVLWWSRLGVFVIFKIRCSRLDVFRWSRLSVFTMKTWNIPNWQKMLKLFFRHFFCYFKKINKNLKICIFGVFLGIFQKSPKSKNPSWLATLLSGNPKYSLCISIHWPLPTYEISSWYLKRFKRYRGGRTDRRTDGRTDGPTDITVHRDPCWI